MKIIPFIDIHTHNATSHELIVTVENLYPGNVLPAFTGRNFYSIGLHPWMIESETENNFSLEMMAAGLEFDHIIFAGECGLDKNTAKDFEEQKRVFFAQVQISEEAQKPLIIHCVRAYNEIIQAYNDINPSVPWILHGYTGNQNITEQLMDKRFLFSFGKILFNEKARAVESFKMLPLEKIFLETDESHGTVIDIYNKASALKNLSVDEMREVVWNNFNRIENVYIDALK